MSIYGMKLHELMITDRLPSIETYTSSVSLLIIRVPGGWLYQSKLNQPPVFVPYHDEFRKEGE